MIRQPAAHDPANNPDAAVGRLFPNISAADAARIGYLVACCDTRRVKEMPETVGAVGVRKALTDAFTDPHATALELLPMQRGGRSGITLPVDQWPGRLQALNAAQELATSGAAFRFSTNQKSPATDGPTVAPELVAALRSDAEFVGQASLYIEGSNDPARFRAMQAGLFATAVDGV
jgi:hypothetical protein